LGLHRAVTREYSDRYRRRALDLDNEAMWDQWARAERLNLKERAPPELPETARAPGVFFSMSQANPVRAELAAQFDAELMECPGPARLREFYSQIRRNSGPLESILRPPWAGNSQSQAAAELLALSGTCEAYKRISGDY